MGKKVGIPRGLFYYKYFPLWKPFLEDLGAQVIISDQTNKRILDDGVKACVDEACLPVKLFHGHVLNLSNRVDYILIPRFTSISRNEYICPEFGGLPDMIRHTLKDLPPIISAEVNLRKSGRNSWRSALETGSYFTDSKAAVKRAFNRALNEYRTFRRCTLEGRLPCDSKEGLACSGGPLCKPKDGPCSIGGPLCKTRDSLAAVRNLSAAKLRIAVIGHVYNVYDSYINMDMLRKLKNFGVEVITVDMVDEPTINRSVTSLNKPIFWNFGRKALGSAFHLIESRGLDGIIYVMSFGCGIDSFVCDLIERRVRRETDIPFIVLSLDEHSGEAGMNTRLEAFIDMIGWRKADETDISAPG